MTLWCALALADPAAVRSGLDVAVDAGPTVAVARRWGASGIGVHAALDGGSVGVVAASRRRQGLLAVDGWAGGAFLPVAVGGALQLGGALSVVVERERWIGRIGVAVPVSVGLVPTVGVAVPVLAEGAWTARIGRLWLGGRGAAGIVVNSYRSSVALSGGVVVGWRRPA